MEHDIGCKIKEARIEKKLTQEQVAELLGVSRQTISNWENEKSYPDIISVIKMSESILLKALAPYYYKQRALRRSTGFVEKLILKINALPADKKTNFSPDEIRLMRTTVNQLRNERLAKGQYTDAADDMLLKLF